MDTSYSTPSLTRRMASWIYEGMLLFGVIFLAGYLFGTLTQTRHALNNRNELQAFLFVIFGIYFVWFWAKGQTLAMKTWNIRVVTTSGQPLTQVRALVRYFSSWLWFLPPLLLAIPLQWGPATSSLALLLWVLLWSLASLFRTDKQFLHDALAGTRLITSEPMSR
jgi:uncharacterized RDD family membrane protein YckC